MPAVKSARIGSSLRMSLPSACGFEGAKLEVLSRAMDFSHPQQAHSKGQRYFTRGVAGQGARADESIARGEVTGPFSNAVAAIRALRTAKA